MAALLKEDEKQRLIKIGVNLIREGIFNKWGE
jgi:hypothetical protein